MTSKSWIAVIVDDSYDDREVMQTALEYYGKTAHGVASLADCIKLLDSLTPDVVITDLAMPGADGWAVLSAIRERLQNSPVPVVAVTAYDSPRLVQQVREAGFDSYVPKPIDPTTFVQHLESLING